MGEDAANAGEIALGKGDAGDRVEVGGSQGVKN